VVILTGPPSRRPASTEAGVRHGLQGANPPIGLAHQHSGAGSRWWRSSAMFTRFSARRAANMPAPAVPVSAGRCGHRPHSTLAMAIPPPQSWRQATASAAAAAPGWLCRGRRGARVKLKCRGAGPGGLPQTVVRLRLHDRVKADARASARARRRRRHCRGEFGHLDRTTTWAWWRSEGATRTARDTEVFAQGTGFSGGVLDPAASNHLGGGPARA